MESGIIELMPVFKGSTSTTAEEMKEYVQGVVTRFSAATGLTVIETIDHERGAFFIVGEEGKEQGIVAIGNVNHSSYFYSCINFVRIGVNNILVASMNSQVNSHLGEARAFNQSSVWMRYIKCEHATVIGFGNANDPLITYTAKWVIQKVRNAQFEELTGLLLYSKAMYASYNKLLENVNKDVALFTYDGTTFPLVPEDKEALSDIYLVSGAELCGMKLYTNKKMAKEMNKVIINGRQFIVAAVGTMFSLITEAASESEAEYND